MNPLEIVLIIIGILIIIISCRLVDSSQENLSKKVGQNLSMDKPISEEDLLQIKNKINDLVSEISEETVVRTDDSLSKISNEKIMAVNDFSEQILEKIKRNHEEVVFLYNMLCDKEKELKAAVREIDASKSKVQDIMDSRKDLESSQPSKNMKTVTSAAKAEMSAAKNTKTVKKEQPYSGTAEPVLADSLSSNNNTQILSLYSQGKSVMEISKLLGLGQGEVKLVIDLFRGKK
jgi:hypothetical protein